jgi:hypothetical protein
MFDISNSNMQKQILAELKELKSIVAQLIGTSELPTQDQFSKEALNKASKLFLKLAAQRGEWVRENELGKYLKADWRAGSFIRSEFGFNACLKEGHYYLYNKKALQKLGQELKARNIDLRRYMEYQRSETEFQKKMVANKKSSKGKRPYEIPNALKDITTSAPPVPDVELVKKDLEQLKTEFFQYKMVEYIDIYRGNHAMMKFVYHFEKYIDPQIKRRCKKWCDDFNYANHALELITKKKDTFVPVKEEDMIQL